jgi:perosamine synthetase
MIPQVKLTIGKEEQTAVQRVMESGWITEGPECEKFRDELLDVIGAPYGVFAPNGTLALVLGLMALGIGAGDKVIVPDSTFIASANAVLMVGATPVFCDVGEDFQFSVANAEKVMDEDVKAIMPVHLYGSTPDMGKVVLFALKHDLLIIEDAAQGMGVTWKGQHTGTFGSIGCFSFYADKTITTGEGGFVVCQNEGIYHRLLLFRNQGRFRSGTFVHPSVGYNFRITDIQAAIGRIQLSKLDSIVKRKREIYSWYVDDLAGLRQIDFILPKSAVPFRAVFLCEDAESLWDYLGKCAIEPRTAFYPLHAQPYFGGVNEDGYSNAWRLWDYGVCLPVYPSLSRAEVTYITDIIKGFYA